MNDATRRVLAALEKKNGRPPARTGQHWASVCPAHRDKRPSLSIAEGDGGRALLRCFGGCPVEAVVSAIGLTMGDLMPADSVAVDTIRRNRPKPAIVSASAVPTPAKTYPTAAAAVAELERRHGPRAALWTYHAGDGEPVGVVVRWDRPDGKDIRPASRNGTGWTLGGMREPRPLYCLPELLARAAEPVFVCEGEKAADAARAVGLLATTSPHGSQSASKADWEPLAGRRATILPDADPAGEKYAADVVRLLADLNPPATVRVVELPGLSRGGDFVDYAAARRAAGRDDAAIRAEVEALAAAAELEPEKPERPRAAVAPYKPFPTRELPSALRTFVDAVARATGTEPAYAALAVLVTTSGCIGNRVAALVRGGWIEPAVLWGALVGRSGVAVKSPVLKLVTRALVELFKTERAAHAEALADYARQKEHHAVRLAQWRQSQRNGPPTDPPVPPVIPPERRVLVSDTTTEKLGALLGDNPLGLLLVRDELAAWVGGFDRYAAGGRGSDQPAWLSMYDAAPLSIDRKTDGASVFVERAAVSVLGSIQPGTLARVFGTAERESGLLARVLMTCPPERPALWTKEGLPDHVAVGWCDLCGRLLELTASTDEHGNVRPRFVPIGSDAEPAWAEWHDRHVRETAELADDHLAAHFGKLKGACVRLALVFTCADVAAGGGGVSAIGLDTMRRAIAVTEWFKGEARRLYGMLGESDEARERRGFVGLIVRKGGSVSVREWQRARSHRTAADAESELEALVKAGAGCWEHVAPGPRGGQPTKRFVLSDGTDTHTTPGGGPENRGSVSVSSVRPSDTGGGVEPPPDVGHDSAEATATGPRGGQPAVGFVPSDATDTDTTPGDAPENRGSVSVSSVGPSDTGGDDEADAGEWGEL